jgi:isoaspartyl peptidase/L-asparaginase-like protein (Ntn-hydrolase superfamily)
MRLQSALQAAVQEVKHPITLARAVMEKTEHCLLVGAGARAFADEIGTARTPTDQLVTAAGKARETRDFSSLSASFTDGAASGSDRLLKSPLR